MLMYFVNDLICFLEGVYEISDLNLVIFLVFSMASLVYFFNRIKLNKIIALTIIFIVNASIVFFRVYFYWEKSGEILRVIIFSILISIITLPIAYSVYKRH